MPLSAALPGAALRMLRMAAGRRALYLALLVGGLFALGILGGQQARAAEDAPTALTVEVHTPVERVAGAAGQEPQVHDSGVQEPSAQGQSVLEQSVPEQSVPERSAQAQPFPGNPVQEPQVQEPAPPRQPSLPEVADGDRILRPVREVVGAVAEGLDDVRGKVPPLSSVPTLPELPQSPGRPGMPVLPGLLELSVLPELPVLPVQMLSASAAAAPQPGLVASSQGGEGDSAGPAEKAAAHGPRGSQGVTSYDTTPPCAFAHPHRNRADSVGPAPARLAPAGDPGGALEHHATVDNGTPRHGAAHAVALNHRAPLRLVPGAAARVGADATRDEYRDIPVSPA